MGPVGNFLETSFSSLLNFSRIKTRVTTGKPLRPAWPCYHKAPMVEMHGPSYSGGRIFLGNIPGAKGWG